MQCPRDGQELETKTIHDGRVEICPSCGGMYLDRGELNRIAEPTTGDLEFSTVDMDTFQHEDETGPVRCPRDTAVEMRKVEFVIETNIILDWCATCGGFWLDGRELVRINDEVKELNEAEREVPDPPMLRLSKFIWNLPLPH